MIRFGILTISDRSFRKEREDKSGPAIQAFIHDQGWQVSQIDLVPDEKTDIQRVLTLWCDQDLCDVALTSGGTGFAPRDVTPEATISIIEKNTPGISEVIRQESLKITPHAMLSRAVAGIRKNTLIINLPGSPAAAVESLQVVCPVIPHAVELLKDSSVSEAHHRINPD
jgi:molybdenum cofactor synthesis domain-containing protein